MNMVALYSAWLYQYVGPLQVKRSKKKSPVFVYHMKVRNQMHCNNSWKVPVQRVGGTGMSWMWDGEWGGFSIDGFHYWEQELGHCSLYVFQSVRKPKNSSYLAKWKRFSVYRENTKLASSPSLSRLSVLSRTFPLRGPS